VLQCIWMDKSFPRYLCVCVCVWLCMYLWVWCIN